MLASGMGGFPPYFVGDVVNYACMNGFATKDERLLKNECTQSSLESSPAVWMKNAEDLSEICLPSNCLK